MTGFAVCSSNRSERSGCSGRRCVVVGSSGVVVAVVVVATIAIALRCVAGGAFDPLRGCEVASETTTTTTTEATEATAESLRARFGLSERFGFLAVGCSCSRVGGAWAWLLMADTDVHRRCVCACVAKYVI